MAPQPGDYLGYDKNEPVPVAQMGIVGGRGYAQLTPEGDLVNHQRYATGSQWEPANRPVNEVTLLQQHLVDAGFGSSKMIKGVWDDSSASAYAGALGAANRAGVSVDTILSRAGGDQGPGGKGGFGGGGGGRGGAGSVSVGPAKQAVKKPNLVTGGHTIELTSPQDIDKSVSDTFQKILGRNVHADETLVLIQDIQNMDRLNQATKFGQEDAVKGANFMQDMATAQQSQAESNASADQTLALHRQAAAQTDALQAAGGSGGTTTILPGADTSGMPIGGFQANLPNRETTAPANPQAYAEWVIKTRMPNEYLGAQMAQRANQMGDFLAKPTAPAGGPLTKTRV